LGTICLGWLWTVILLMSAFWVVGITGMSHWCPALVNFEDCKQEKGEFTYRRTIL
jgi:hypothetical protein